MALKLRRVLPVLIALLLFALFIWFGAPWVGVGESRPFESATVRLIIIGLVVVAWALWVLVKRLRARRASDKLVAAVVQQAATEPRPSADVVQLRERFEEAAAVLKAKKRTGNSLYDMPWYVIIGAPGSGKTTALINSGLHFPLEQRTGATPCAGLAAPGTATGGSPTRRSCSTRRGAIRRRTRMPPLTAPAGGSSWPCSASTAAVVRSTA
jgi:type VI secretion system protein ImpL